MCVTVTTTPRECNRELGRSDREATDRDSVQTSLTLSSASARTPFSNYLRDFQALILLRTQQIDLPIVYMLLVVALNREICRKAMEYEHAP